MSNQKKRKWPIILLALILLAAVSNSNGTNNSNTATTTATKKPAITQSATNTPVPDTKATEQPDAPLTITLRYPELGEYGEYYTFNQNVEKAEESDKHTDIQCYVPAGKYTVTNEGKYPAFIFIYSRETVISSMGWEEAAECWQSDMLQPGDSCDIEVPEGHYIKLLQNNVWKLVALSSLAETKLDQYISSFGLSDDCKHVIMTYTPNFEDFSHMEADGTQAYSILLTSGMKYYLSVSKENEPLCLQSSETDYNSRARYYDAFAK